VLTRREEGDQRDRAGIVDGQEGIHGGIGNDHATVGRDRDGVRVGVRDPAGVLGIGVVGRLEAGH
jgi:hypothetical protein